MPEVVIGKDMVTDELITIGDVERCGGFYILGEPRTGKSHLMISMALQDMQHDHPVLFIDPHFDAITDIIDHLPLKRQKHVILLDPTDKNHSFGLNLLQCKDPHDPMELDRAYGRVQDIFIKLWGNDQGHLGIWVEKILRNAVYLLLENPGYTLVDIPLLLGQDTSFRNYLLRNVKINPDVKDFWYDEFDRLSPRDKTEQVGPLLSRLDTFRMRILRHIVGQSQSTLDFHTILNTSPTPYIVLLRMPVNLPDTVRSAIGTMLISQILAATFDRDQLPEAERRLFAVYCDEFQMFVTQDFAKLFTQTGKFYLMPHIAHQVREGQLKPDDPNTGATLAAPNKAFFSVSITDSPKVAPLMAKRVEATEKRREAELVISPRPVEDLWERGHPLPEVTEIRGKYFWIVELLRNNANEKYVPFDPFQVPPQYRHENPVTFQMDAYDDWEWYQSTSDMLRRGISLLNQYYYDWMNKRYDPDKPITDAQTDAQIELIIKVIECWGGVLGFLPMLQPVYPDAKRARLAYLLTEKLRQQFEQEKRDKIQAAKDEAQHLKEHGYRLGQGRYQDRHGNVELRTQLTYPDKEWTTIPSTHVSRKNSNEPSVSYEEHRRRAEEQRLYINELSEQILRLEQSQPPRTPWIPQTLKSPKDIKDIQTMAIQAGMAGSEVEQLIEWEVKPLERSEKDELAAMVTHPSEPLDGIYPSETTKLSGLGRVEEYVRLVKMLLERYDYDGDYARDEAEKRLQAYETRHAEALSKRLCPTGQPPTQAKQRLEWQVAELRQFITDCFRELPRLLAKEPIKVPSGKYEETLKVERTQNDLIVEMGLELSRLTPRTAYVHVVQEESGIQVVRQAKIRTLPLPDPNKQSLMQEIIERSHATAYKARTEIEAEIRERQAKWRRGSGNEPPPTRTGGDKPSQIAPSRSESNHQPPATFYLPNKTPEEKPPENRDDAPSSTVSDENGLAPGSQEEDILDFTASLQESRQEERGTTGTPEHKATVPTDTDPQPDRPPHLRPQTLQLESLTFFESDGDGYPPKEFRQYSTRFSQSTARFINFELHVSNRLYKQQDQKYELVERYYKLNENLQELYPPFQWLIETSKEKAEMLGGTGNDEPGRLLLGTYGLEIIIDGVKFAEGTFTIE